MVTKSIMREPRSGRATPRMAETPSGMLNSIGLQGPGVDVFLDRDLPWLDQHDVPAVVSIAAGSVEEYVKLASRIRGRKGLAMIEVNISCPNVEDRGQVFACDPAAPAPVIAAVSPGCATRPPEVTSSGDAATAGVDAGAHGLSMINTTLGVVIDTDTLRPTLAHVTGGLSGPAIRPMAVRCVWQVRAALPEVPILGMGGIRSGLDALQFLAAGANAVSVGTAIFGDPSAPVRVLAELEEALALRGFSAVRDVVGIAHRPAPRGIVQGAVPAVSEGAEPPGSTAPHLVDVASALESRDDETDELTAARPHDETDDLTDVVGALRATRDDEETR